MSSYIAIDTRSLQISSPVDMDVPIKSDEAVRVRVGVVLVQNRGSECKDCVIVSEDGHSVDYTSGKNGERTLFSFDQVVTLENIQGLYPEFLRPLAESVCSGYNGTLLMGGTPRTEKTGNLIDHDIIKQVLTTMFSQISSKVKEELLTTVSFIQFYPDDSALDLLNPETQVLKPVSHPVLGCLVGGVCEVSVSSVEEAYTLYEAGMEALRAKASAISSRCSSLFSVAVEWRLHPEHMEPELCRSRLQLFSLAGGASKIDLRGVSPLAKVLDQIQFGAMASDKLLPFLLTDALIGNSRTVLLYSIQPQGFLDDETPCALALAHRLKSLVTKVTIVQWCPKIAEQEIRDDILELRTKMMSQGDHRDQDTHRLAELTLNLQILKDQSWDKRREKSERIKNQIKGCWSPNSKLHSQSVSDHTIVQEATDRMRHLQVQLRQEMEEHIRDKGNAEKVQERVTRIQQLRKAVRDEMMEHGPDGEKADPSQQSQLEYNKVLERRKQLKVAHGSLIQEEVEKMERELEHEKMEGAKRELLVLARERQVLVLQMEALRTEALQAETDLEDQYGRHQRELHCLREESLQVFRLYRKVSDEQRRLSEGRYRTLLLEAVHDAVYLSAQNQQLQADNEQLRRALGDLQDSLAVRGDPKAELKE